MTTTKIQACNSNFIKYPGLKGEEIKNSFRISVHFSLIAYCLSFDELLKTAACLSRQFRSMVFSYIKDQIPRTNKLLTLFLEHFQSLKKENAKLEIEPKTLQEIQEQFNKNVVTQCNIYLEYVEEDPEYRKSYRRYGMAISKLINETCYKVTETVKLVKKDQLPPIVVKYIDGNIPSLHDKLPNHYHKMMVNFAMNIELQDDNYYFSYKWMRESIQIGELKLIEAVFDKMVAREERHFFRCYSFIAYSLTKIGAKEKFVHALAEIDNHFNKDRQLFLQRQLFSIARVIAQIEMAKNIGELNKLSSNIQLLISVTQDELHFSGFEELALALVKKAIQLNDFGVSTYLNYFCNQLKDIDCDKAIDYVGNHYLNTDNLNNEMHTVDCFVRYSSFNKNDSSISGVSLGRRIIRHFIKSNKLGPLNTFINRPMRPEKRGYLQDVIIDFYLESGRIEEALQLANEIDRNCTILSSIYVKIGVLLAEKCDLSNLLLIIPKITNHFSGCEKIVRTLLAYHGPEIALNFILHLPAMKNNQLNLDLCLFHLVKFYLRLNDLKAIENIINILESQYSGLHKKCVFEIIKYFEKIDKNKSFEWMEKFKTNFNYEDNEFILLYVNTLIRKGEKEKAKEYLSLIFGSCWVVLAEKIDSGTEITDLD